MRDRSGRVQPGGPRCAKDERIPIQALSATRNTLAAEPGVEVTSA